MAHSSVLAWARLPGQSQGQRGPWGHKESARSDQLSTSGLDNLWKFVLHMSRDWKSRTQVPSWSDSARPLSMAAGWWLLTAPRIAEGTSKLLNSLLQGS